MSARLRSSIDASGRLARATAVLAVLMCAAPAWVRAQDDRYPRPPAGITATVSPTAYTPGASGWSGEPGSSGDPLMTPTPIRAADANFHNCLESLLPAG